MQATCCKRIINNMKKISQWCCFSFFSKVSKVKEADIADSGKDFLDIKKGPFFKLDRKHKKNYWREDKDS